MPYGSIAVASRPAFEAHALSLPVVAVAMPRALRVQLRPSRGLCNFDLHSVGSRDGQERKVAEFGLEQDGRGQSTGGVAESWCT